MMLAYALNLLVTFAVAGGLSPNVDLESTGVLPSKVTTARYKQYFIFVDEAFNSQGNLNPIAQPLNKSISWNEVLAARSGFEQDLMRASLSAQGIDINAGGPGSLSTDINVSIDVKVPILGFGINEKHSIGIVVPVYKIKTKYASSFVTSAEGEAWFASISSPSTKAEIKASLENAMQNTLQSLGYEPLQSEDFTALGDIRLVHKYFIGEFGNEIDGKHSFLWRNEVNAPTGRGPNADKLVDMSTGDGQWDFGMGLNYEYTSTIEGFNIPVTYGLSGFYNYQFADSLERRIPVNPDSPLSPDKEKVERKLGDQITLGAGISFGNSRDGSNLGFGYTYQYMYKTDYKAGSHYNGERYQWLDDNEEDAHLRSIVALYSYSTIDKYLNKSFPVPLTWTLSYAQPIEGKNVNDSRIYYTELQLFF